MKFGPVETGEAEGTILAHSVLLEGGRLSKGHVLDAGDLQRLAAGGHETVIVARLEPDDLREDEAAQRLADSIAPDHLRFSPASTGRVNIYAACDGLFVADKAIVDAFNRVDPAITLACLADHAPVRVGEMVATIKIIPLAVAAGAVTAASSILQAGHAFEVKPFHARAVTLITTRLPALKPSVMDKTRRVFEQRLALSGSRIVTEIRTAHEAGAVAAAIENALPQSDMIVVFGASAMADFNDVIPAAIRAAGGYVEHAGMPVDPGNLLSLGWINDVAIIGAPGCARSPRENGFDWILHRILAGERPSASDITGMGVGGLLMEIPTRPQLREPTTHEGPEIGVGIIVLAAGKASRMGEGGPHKLLAEFAGEPLIRRSVKTALAAADRVIVVTGHRREEIEVALDGLAVNIAFNPDYASGMASSLTAGLSARDMRKRDGMLVLLADMPGITTDDLKRLIGAFRKTDGQAIIRAVASGKRGNPVILPRATYPDILKLQGDIGARHIIETCGLPVIDVDIGAAAHLDVDTPEAVMAAGGVLKG